MAKRIGPSCEKCSLPVSDGENSVPIEVTGSDVKVNGKSAGAVKYAGIAHAGCAESGRYRPGDDGIWRA